MLTWLTTATTTTKRPRTPKRPTPCPCCTQCCHFQTLYKFCAENLQRFHWRIYCRWNSAVWKAPNQPYTTPPHRRPLNHTSPTPLLEGHTSPTLRPHHETTENSFPEKKGLLNIMTTEAEKYTWHFTLRGRQGNVAATMMDELYGVKD